MVRALFTKFDHLSHLSKSYLPQIKKIPVSGLFTQFRFVNHLQIQWSNKALKIIAELINQNDSKLSLRLPVGKKLTTKI